MQETYELWYGGRCNPNVLKARHRHSLSGLAYPVSLGADTIIERYCNIFKNNQADSLYYNHTQRWTNSVRKQKPLVRLGGIAMCREETCDKTLPQKQLGMAGQRSSSPEIQRRITNGKTYMRSSGHCTSKRRTHTCLPLPYTIPVSVHPQ